MKTIIQIILFLAFMFSYGNRIDLLNTTQEVIDFVREVHPDFDDPKFTIRSTEQMKKDLYCDGIFNDWNVKNWEKVDLNHDGRTDLVFTAHFYGYKSYVLLDTGSDTYSLLPLPKKSSSRNCDFTQVIKIDGKNYLKHHGQIQIRDNENKNQIRYKTISVIDTLTVKYGGIFELDDNQTSYTIEQVSIETVPCFGTCPVFTLTIDKTGNTQFIGKEHVSKKGKFTTKIPQQTVDALWAMIAYAKLKELKNEYENPWADGRTVTIRVDFSDGSTKKIRDHGLQGTFGLRSIYDKLMELVTKTDWK
nr:DUF6438 domain-containing protein [Allomuricauda sp.]